MTQGADGAQRSLTSINLGREAGRIEVFHRTQRLADEGRAWFETLAGAAVQQLTREITDSAGHLARTGSSDAARAPRFGGTTAAVSAQGLPPEAMAQAIEQVIHRHYATGTTRPSQRWAGSRRARRSRRRRHWGVSRACCASTRMVNSGSLPHRAGRLCPTSFCGTRWESIGEPERQPAGSQRWRSPILGHRPGATDLGAELARPVR
jgi:hypothetical protein